MTSRKLGATACASLIAALVIAPGADAKPKKPEPKQTTLDYHYVAVLETAHDAAVENAKGFVMGVRTVTDICTSETKAGKGFAATDAAAKRYASEVTALKAYNTQLAEAVAFLGKAKLDAKKDADQAKVNKDLAGAVEQLASASGDHKAEFFRWEGIQVAISSHNCDGIQSAVDAAKDAAGNAWTDEHGGLFLLDRAVSRAKKLKLPDAKGTDIDASSPYDGG